MHILLYFLGAAYIHTLRSILIYGKPATTRLAPGPARGCELVYAVMPKTGSLKGLAENRARHKAETQAREVEHAMTIEDQAPGKNRA